MASIRRFLLTSTLLLTAVVIAIAGMLHYLDAKKNINGLFDAQIVEMSHYMRGFAQQYDLNQLSARVLENKDFGPVVIDHAAFQEEPLSFQKKLHRYESKRVYQIWNTDGYLLARHKTSPTFPISTMEPGLATNRLGEHSWHTYTYIDEDTGMIYVAGQRGDIRDAITRSIALKRTLPLLLIFPLLAICIWNIVGYGIRRINRVSAELNDRAFDNLDPLTTKKIPQEIVPLVDSLNALFHRLNEAYKREKRFSADAAHELRTPLAASKTMVQLAMNAKNIKECQDILNDAEDGVNRCTHVVKQLATLSSLNPEKALTHREQIKLYDVVQQVIDEIKPLAEDKHTEVRLELDKSITLFSDLTSVQILLRNIIDNAVRYSPENSRVNIQAEKTDQDVTLKIIDNGPGIPEALRERVFERFYRKLGTQEKGSGLGLSIVAQICELHQADISLAPGDKGKGLCLGIKFPLFNQTL